jgi:hypothetical protein
MSNLETYFGEALNNSLIGIPFDDIRDLGRLVAPPHEALLLEAVGTASQAADATARAGGSDAMN